jgi:hypothetical protein
MFDVPNDGDHPPRLAVHNERGSHRILACGRDTARECLIDCHDARCRKLIPRLEVASGENADADCTKVSGAHDPCKCAVVCLVGRLSRHGHVPSHVPIHRHIDRHGGRFDTGKDRDRLEDLVEERYARCRSQTPGGIDAHGDDTFRRKPGVDTKQCDETPNQEAPGGGQQHGKRDLHDERRTLGVRRSSIRCNPGVRS